MGARLALVVTPVEVPTIVLGHVVFHTLQTSVVVLESLGHLAHLGAEAPDGGHDGH